ncbi:aldo/keto reductase [Methylobacterium oxalidis]|uniref:Oxidoreductase n=1 Tax=Methylobacterium oxalidis TaxID=944322 RepID=A0A512J5C6_9HYPH|nr:aldo/keto reductase [Methylobacterium oxalidis]GEP05171.1 oxidoreductase [Methylobacterium oxalidis]GJE31821.1 Pyridoxine 4-dehydrogenase [Methylobacterium oxalidis]GLS62537.1 oxidoreductase [Methylobacterium oxalidis]
MPSETSTGQNSSPKNPSERNPSGTFAIGGDLTVNRLGFGAMRITGSGIWGEPPSRRAAEATLARVPELGINLIDTADSYGPFVSEALIRAVLHPYPGLVVATKGGLTRHGPDIWRPVGNPDYLRQCVLMSLRRLGLERIDLWQLHRIGPDCPREVQFEAIARMRDEGLIRHVGLSEVSIDDIEAARAYFPVATVQNQYNLVDRTSEAVLDHCTQQGIGFIPWAPLARGALAREGSALAEIAGRHGAGEGAVALAWLLKRSPVMLPIPGTGDPDHLADNMAGAFLALTEAEFEALDEQGRAAWEAGAA